MRPIPHPTSAAPPQTPARLPAHHLRAAQSEVVEQSVVEASASRSDKSEETRKALVGKLATHMAYRPVPLSPCPCPVCCRTAARSRPDAGPAGDQARQAREGGLRRRAAALQQPLPAPVRAPQTMALCRAFRPDSLLRSPAGCSSSTASGCATGRITRCRRASPRTRRSSWTTSASWRSRRSAPRRASRLARLRSGLRKGNTTRKHARFVAQARARALLLGRDAAAHLLPALRDPGGAVARVGA